MSYYNSNKKLYYRVVSRKEKQIVIEGPLEGIYELKPAQGTDEKYDFKYVQVIKGNPVKSFTDDEILVVKGKKI